MCVSGRTYDDIYDVRSYGPICLERKKLVAVRRKLLGTKQIVKTYNALRQPPTPR